MKGKKKIIDNFFSPPFFNFLLAIKKIHNIRKAIQKRKREKRKEKREEERKKRGEKKRDQK